MLSILIPARNERFLPNTIDDILNKARGEVEIIVILDGYWPDPPLKDDPRVKIIHRGTSLGMRNALNSGAAIAKGKYLAKCDAHIMFDEGFDLKLAADCEPDWISIPRRYSLDPENWCRRDKRPVDYLYIEAPGSGGDNALSGKVWKREEGLPEIDDLMTFQGSFWFMHRDYFYQLGALDEEKYGSFRKDPQELSFKAWCSGGRVIRNKKTWYAHLYKGKKYGRGYHASKPDWRKGDNYIKNWLTNSAWDERQTKSFKWMVDHFMPMPGWENYPWTEAGLNLEGRDAPTSPATSPAMPVADGADLSPSTSPSVSPSTLVADKDRPRLYQNLEIEGVPFSRARPERMISRFWNEGKFNSFIAPHLPEDCTDQVFVEMGCNAGLFLKLAKDRGYRHVVGIEKDKTPVIEGSKYRDKIGYDYKILKRQLGGKFGGNGSFDIDELPVADVTVMSTFHYYIDINNWVKYLDRLKSKSCYVLIVSRPRMKRLHWKALANYSYVKEYFKDWEEMGLIDNVPKEGDPDPRDLYSVMFKSPVVERIRIEDVRVRVPENEEMYVAVGEFARQIAANENTDPFETDYYKKWVERKEGRWSNRMIKKFVQDKYNLMLDIRENGLRDPLVLQGKEEKLSDGGHRLAIMKALGHKSVIVRKI